MKRTIALKKGLVLLLALVMVSGIFTGCSSSSGDKAEQQEKTYKLKEAADLGSLKITANKKKESKGSAYNKPKSGTVFLGVEFTVENVSDKDQSVSSLMLFDCYVDGEKLDLSLMGSAEFNSKTLDGNLAPGKKLTGYYVVEAPTKWKEVEFQVKSEWLSNTKAVFVIKK